jgi:hypothetical protein
MKLIRFTQTDDEVDVYINPVHVVAVEEVPEAQKEALIITTAHGHFCRYRVNCNALTVISIFENTQEGPIE